MYIFKVVCLKYCVSDTFWKVCSHPEGFSYLLKTQAFRNKVEDCKQKQKGGVGETTDTRDGILQWSPGPIPSPSGPILSLSARNPHSQLHSPGQKPRLPTLLLGVFLQMWNDAKSEC